MKILYHHSRIGIWGFGITGKSAEQYLSAQGYRIYIMDQRKPTDVEQHFLQEKNITWYTQETESDLFFNSSDFIISSPGININQFRYATYRHKFITELDFFYQQFRKPIIAITGSVGKTSITQLFSHICKKLSIPVVVGGNIGTPTFDLITQQNNVEYALLEVSSFQLMHCTTFAPTIAVWTNFYPNHLDYHQTEDEYFLAKYKILEQQSSQTFPTFSVIPLILREKIPAPQKNHTRTYVTLYEPMDKLLTLNDNELLYYTKNNAVWRYACGIHTPLISITSEILNLSFIENIIIIAAICDTMCIPTNTLQTIATTAQLPAHRLEHIGTINNVIFYNDSKATTCASTLTAVEKLKNKPLHLFLGGCSKGIDRAPLIMQLKNNVTYVYCFGKEAEYLYTLCKNNSIPAMHFTTLDQAFAYCIQTVNADDCVLLSPAGSSFDLYKNYEERGDHFKQLLRNYMQRNTVWFQEN